MKKLKERFPHTYHWFYLLFVILYIAYFFLVEHIVSPEKGYYSIHCALDDLIPFCEYFAPLYYAWYVFMGAVGLYLLFQKDEQETFVRYIKFLMISFFLSPTFCLFFPNGQDLRPTSFPRDNVFTQMMILIYQADTNTNVFPSMHVIGSFGALFAMKDSKKLSSRGWMILGSVLAVLISISTVFVKQHSVIDIFGGLGMVVVMYYFIYQRPKKNRHPSHTPSSSVY